MNPTKAVSGFRAEQAFILTVLAPPPGSLKNGRHSVEARAYDGINYSETASLDIVVKNPAPAGKGFIPGPGAAGVVIAIIVAARVWRRRARGGG